MQKRYSIAEAGHNLAEIVHELNNEPVIELTRHGAPVAVLLSLDTYNKLQSHPTTFWEAYSAFRETIEEDELADLADAFDDVRDRSPGRDVHL